MSQIAHRDLERGNDADGHSDQTQLSSSDQPVPASQGGIIYGDSSRPLYTMYSKIVQDEDNKSVERNRQSTDGVLIVTGLFFATVAAMLSVSIPDLKPNPQDDLKFYLANIYELLAKSNVTGESIPLAKPPVFTPAYPVVRANFLWLLSLLVSLFGAMLSTLEQRFIFRYITITQNKEYPPELRARMHAMFVKSKSYRLSDKKPSLVSLHTSFFIFIAGFLFYFAEVIPQILPSLAFEVSLFAFFYVMFTVVPMFSSSELFYTPLTPFSLSIYLRIAKWVSQICSWIEPLRGLSDDIRRHHRDLRDRYRAGFSRGKAKSAEEAALNPSSQIDAEVLGRLLSNIDEDHALDELFDAIPGFCDSNLVQKPLDSEVTIKLRQSLRGFLDRTFSSHLVAESVRSDRLITCLNAAHSALGPSAVPQILGDFFKGQSDEALTSVELGHSLRRWAHSSDDLIEPAVRRVVACIIARAQDRDEQWTTLVKEVFGVPDGAFRDYLAHGDSMLLAILIHLTREGLSAGRSERCILESLSQFDIRNTAAELQHEFCALWNEIIQAARNEGGSSNTPSTQALSGIRRLFAALHQGTDPASTRFCDVPGHRPDLSTPVSATTSPSVPPRTQQSDSAIASPHPALASQPPLANASDVATEDAMPGNTDISDAAYPIRGFSGDPTQGQVEETSEIAPSAAFGSLPTSPLSNRTPIELSSTIDSALTQPSHHPYAAAYVDSAATPHTNSPPTQPSNPTQASPRLALTSQPPLAASLPDVATEDEMQGNADASVISNTTDPMRGSTSGDGPAPADLQQAEETRTISPPSVFASLPTPISSPALSSQFPARLPTAIDPAVTHTDHVPAASSSPSTTAPLSGSTRVTTISDQCRSLAGAQGDTQGTQEVHTRSPPGGDTAL